MFGVVLCGTGITSKTKLSLRLRTVNMLSNQVSKRKRTKGIAHVAGWKLPSIHQFIEKLQISAAVPTLVILFCHNWKNSRCQPPHPYWEFVRGLFQKLSLSRVGGSNTSESRHLTKPILHSSYATGRKKSKWSTESARSILLSKIILTPVQHIKLAPPCS